MAKWYGAVGYGSPEEISPGVYEDKITERKYSGDVIRNSNRWSNSPDSTIDELNISNQISILADPYAYENFHKMKYVEFMGTNWKITNIEVQYPRLILSIGGVYNG